MSRIFSVLFLSAFFAAVLPSPADAAPLAHAAPPTDKVLHVVIDPGHGGQDLGATRDSFVEAEIVLQIAEKVKQQLQQKNVQVTLTRKDARGISLKNRVQLANDLGADLFVSLHANTSTSESITGMEFYFNSPQSINHQLAEVERSPQPDNREVIRKIRNDFAFYDKTAKSLNLTRAIQNRSSTIEEKSVIKRAPFYVIDHTTMPSVLVELGFISNRREAKKLVSPEFQDKVAAQLATAILEYKEKSDKSSSL